MELPKHGAICRYCLHDIKKDEPWDGMAGWATYHYFHMRCYYEQPATDKGFLLDATVVVGTLTLALVRWLLCLLLLCFFAGTLYAGEVEEAARIAKRWNAQTEVVLWDGTRVDILTEDTAYEVDWPHKWAEAVGQSLYYAHLTEKRPGVVLLVTDIEKERRYVYRCQTLCVRYGIRLHVERLHNTGNTDTP